MKHIAYIQQRPYSLHGVITVVHDIRNRASFGTQPDWLHWALEAVVMVEACTGMAAVVTWWWWASVVTCRPPVPACTRLTGLLVSSDRFWGFRKRGVVTRLGVLPADVFANSRLPPSRDVMGIVPLEARAAEGRRSKLVYFDRVEGEKIWWSKYNWKMQSLGKFSIMSFTGLMPQQTDKTLQNTLFSYNILHFSTF